MKDIRIDEARTCDAESGIPASIMEGKLDSVPPKSSLEEIAALQCNGPQTVKSVPRSGEQDPLDPVSCMSPLVKECNGIDLSSGGGELCPITPSSNGVVKMPSASNQTDDLEVHSDWETPTHNTFNPFAPAPEELPLAPKKKMPWVVKIPTRRKLNFDTCCDSDKKVESTISDEEDYILESIYKSILELVVSNQTNEISDGMVEEDDSCDEVSDGVKTPTSMPLLTGIAETCPDAPLRLRSESRMPDQSICRKLEFDSV